MRKMSSTNMYQNEQQEQQKQQKQTVQEQFPVALEKNEIQTSQKKKHFISSVFVFSRRLVLYVLIMTAVAWVSFLIFFVSPEKVVVPYVVGKDIVSAILELQEKNLRVEIVEQLSDNPEDKGLVLSQDPKKGISVKQRRTVQLIISKGGIVESIPNFVGFFLNDIYEDYDNTFNGLGRYFEIYSVNKVFDKSIAGTILGQHPPASTPLRSSFTNIQLVVSRGSAENENIFPDLLGLSFEEVFSFIQKHSPSFEFYFVDNDSLVLDSERDNEVLSAGIILEQIPVAGERINVNTALYIGLRKNTILIQKDTYQEQDSEEARDNLEKTTINVDLLSIPLSEVEPPHVITIYTNEESSGENKKREKQEYLSFKSTGGELKIPYYVVPDINFSIFRFGQEVWSHTIMDR